MTHSPWRAHPLRLALALPLLVALALLALPASDARAATGSIPSNTGVPGVLSFDDVVVTANQNGTVTASASMYVAENPWAMAVTLEYQNSANWTVTVARNSAPGFTPPASTSLDVNDVSGTITKQNGAVSYELTLSGQTIGDGTFDMAVHADSSGLVASTVVNEVSVGGIVLETASIQVSTVDSTADIIASMQTQGGDFDASLSVEGSPPPGRYSINLNVSGADLKGSGSDFHLDSFSFSYTFSTDTYACTYVSVAFAGKATVGNDTYTLKNGTIAFCGQTLYTFLFDIEYDHYIPWQRKTIGGDLRIAWSAQAGSVKKPDGKTVRYTQGFFGSIDLFQKRSFSKKYRGRHFRRNITIGLAFGVAVYQPSANADWTEAIGGGGYVDADRVSGAIGCVFQVAPDTDMNCGVHMRLNPSWAGIYHYDWNDL